MANKTQVSLKDVDGIQVALFEDWRQLTWSREVNDVSTCVFTINGNDSRVGLFTLDSQLEVYRGDLAYSLPLYKEAEYFVRDKILFTDDNGLAWATFTCVSYTDFLLRRVIAWEDGSTQTNKSGVSETVIKEYVDENLGPSATAIGGRYRDGTFTGLTIQADDANGDAWEGSFVDKNLLKVCQEVAAGTGVDFDIVGTGAATFEFRVYDGQRGADRSDIGLTAGSTTNGAGNVPVIFALERDNMSRPRYKMLRSNEFTVAVVSGRGLQDSKEITIRTSADTGDSPWNDIEMSVNASSQDTAAARNSAGDEALKDNEKKETFTFQPIQVLSTVYGDPNVGTGTETNYYHFGDLVTAYYQGIEVTRQITGVRASVQAGRDSNIENISFDLTDYNSS